MRTAPIFRTPLLLLLAGILLFGGLGAALAVPADQDQIPKDTRKLLERAVRDHIKEIYDQEDENGRHYQKARSSFYFRPTDDGRYTVTLYKDVVGERGDTMRSERYTVTLAQEKKDAWKIVDEKLEETAGGMTRRMPGDEKFFRFDSIDFDREGLKIHGGKGSLVVYSRGGEKTSMELVADGLSYEYKPPVELDYYSRYKIIQKLKESDFVFQPESVSVNCTPKRCESLLENLFVNLQDSSMDGIDAELRKSVDEDLRQLEESRRKNNLGGFTFADHPDRDRYMIFVKKQRRDHYLGLIYDNWQPKEVAFTVSGYWPALFRYYSEQTRKANLDPYELERRPDVEARFFDVVSIKGEVELGTVDAETMLADVTYVLRAQRDFKELDFGVVVAERGGNEERNATRPRLTVEYIQDGDGNDLNWVQLGGNFGRVLLNEELKRGEKITVHMKFKNAKAIRDFSWSYKGMARGGWLPFVRFGDMIDEFEMTIKVPEQFTTLGIGRKMSEKKENGLSVTHWKAFHPVTFPTIIYGKYYKMESETVARKLDGTPIPVTIYVDENALSGGSTVEGNPQALMAEMRSGRWGIRPKQLRPLVEQAAQAINLYTKMYQVDYPFSKLDLVNDPVGGLLYGQAPSSIIYLGSMVFRGAGTLASGSALINPGDAGRISKFLKSVVAHETGHQWWGASTSNANSGNYWFVESLAEYSSAIYTEQAYGYDQYLQQVEAWREGLVDAHTMAPVQESYTTWAGGMAANQRNIYARGPYAFHILRETFGAPKTFTFLREMAKKLAGKQIVTEDMKMISEMVFGADMGWFWNQWIRGVGLPEYAYELSSRATEDGQYLVEGTVTQRVVLGKNKEVLEGKYYRGAVPVTVVYDDGSKEKLPLLVEGQRTDVRFKVKRKPKKIVFNGEGEILAEKLIEGKTF